MSLRVKFTLLTSGLLALVMLLAGFMLSSRAGGIAAAATELRIAAALELTVAEGAPGNFEQIGNEATVIEGTDVQRFPVRYGLSKGRRDRALAYQARNEEAETSVQLLVPTLKNDKSGGGLNQLILAVMVMVIAAGALVSLFIAHGVAKPIEVLVDDVRQIARGNLIHKTNVRGGGELSALGREIDKMAAALKEGQATELELSAREREMEVAAEVRDSLIPGGMPSVPGYDLEALQSGCPTPGGDFFDVLEYEDGRIGMLICEVNGEGVPGALVGAASRAYLSSLLLPATDVAEGMKSVNRHLSKGLRRGMCISVIYALLEPKSGQVQLLCAGHKVPLLHFRSADNSVHKLQAEGLALGLDKGPVFDRRLERRSFEMAPGDRILLANTGPILVQNPAGQEYGEDRFYRLAMKRATECSEEVLGVLEGALDAYADPGDFPHDISIITIRRDA
jgi:sigma-B regulation protein RsbU (phosphoserine phosphatase)